MSLLSCPMCLGSPTLTLSDLSCAVSRFAAAVAASAAIRCPVCNAATSGLSGLAAHLAEHQREHDEEERRRHGCVKIEAGTCDNGNNEDDVFASLNQVVAPDSRMHKEDGARYVGERENSYSY